MAKFPDSWDWHKVAAGHYLVEGYVVRRYRAEAWNIRKIGTGLILASVPSLAAAIEWIERRGVSG